MHNWCSPCKRRCHTCGCWQGRRSRRCSPSRWGRSAAEQQGGTRHPLSSFASVAIPTPQSNIGGANSAQGFACLPSKHLGVLHQLASWAVQGTGLATKADTKWPTKRATKTRPTLQVPEEQMGVSEGHMHSPLHVPPTSHSFCGRGAHEAMPVVPVEGQAVGCAVPIQMTIARCTATHHGQLHAQHQDPCRTLATSAPCRSPNRT